MTIYRKYYIYTVLSDGGGESNMGEIEMIIFIFSETAKGNEYNPM